MHTRFVPTFALFLAATLAHVVTSPDLVTALEPEAGRRQSCEIRVDLGCNHADAGPRVEQHAHLARGDLPAADDECLEHASVEHQWIRAHRKSFPAATFSRTAT